VKELLSIDSEGPRLKKNMGESTGENCCAVTVQTNEPNSGSFLLLSARVSKITMERALLNAGGNLLTVYRTPHYCCICRQILVPEINTIRCFVCHPLQVHIGAELEDLICAIVPVC